MGAGVSKGNLTGPTRFTETCRRSLNGERICDLTRRQVLTDVLQMAKQEKDNSKTQAVGPLACCSAIGWRVSFGKFVFNFLVFFAE